MDSIFSNTSLDEFIMNDGGGKGKNKGKCIHNKYRCRECGRGFCKHGKDKRLCKEGCGGSQLCKHGKGKYYCKECGGKGICIHNTNKYTCSKCNPNKYNPVTKKCEHGKWRNTCNICGYCEHNKRKDRCIECIPNAFCKHEKRKDRCRECNPNKEIKEYVTKKCEHGKDKRFCKKCGGSRVCKSSWCETIVKKKYDGYCMFCFMHLFPDKEVARNYKTKEKEVVDRVKEAFPDFTWVHDKQIQDGCSKRRPDLLLDLGSHIIIIEIDENKHSGYDCSCENKRLMELSQDVHHRPIVFIRFNPDKYVDEEGNTIRSCWRMNKNGILMIDKTKEEEWKKRTDVLKETIQYWTDNIVEKTVEIIELFY